MTVHDMTLPGFLPLKRFCREKYCSARIKVRRGDKYAEWNATLTRGDKAITEYLKKYNKAQHRDGCRYKDLPPSVHVWCRKGDRSEFEALAKELIRLETARQSS
ncbi:hypothetical protein [Nonomuraea rubra]|uniref:Uncharacterized protein n=1 Tax=Nonomuraea rubra TaxID=46180 RepID=A0A7X0NP62_9ACTN|nr:hypothetical protein [Nonomuraea rubra]MBB6547047.1 hypothetical protein [Nonomuraea rubra]